MKLLLIIILVTSGIATFAQNKYAQKLYTYFEKRSNENVSPGKGRSSDSGNFSIAHFIYVEVAEGKTPIWQTATIDGEPYVVHPTLIEENPFKPGERKSDGRMVAIRTQPGNRLWKLEFDLDQETNLHGDQISPGLKGIELQAVVNNRKIKYTISKEVELLPGF